MARLGLSFSSLADPNTVTVEVDSWFLPRDAYT